jgi:hypothetical protein
VSGIYSHLVNLAVKWSIWCCPRGFVFIVVLKHCAANHHIIQGCNSLEKVHVLSCEDLWVLHRGMLYWGSQLVGGLFDCFIAGRK